MLESLDYKWVLAGLATLISFCNLLYYISTVLKGKTKPHMYTWLIWGLLTAVAAATQWVSGGGAGTFLTTLVAMNCFVIATLAYFKGEKNITRSDKLFLGACLIAIALWPLTPTPLLSLVLATLIDTVGYFPTIRKSFSKPQEENLISFSIYGCTWFMSLIALADYNFLTAFYPAVTVVTSWGLMIFLIIRRRQLGYKVFT